MTSDGYLLVYRGIAPAGRYVPAGEPDVLRPAAVSESAGGWLRFARNGDRVEPLGRGSPGLPSWTMWRKSRYTAAVAIFAAFGILLGVWGALEPWAS